MKGKFYGLGVGPGDPGLITLKACKILEEVDVLCIPKSSSDKDSLALQVVRGILTREYDQLELAFPMTTDSRVLEESWYQAGEKVAHKLRQGLQVAFVTIGDPMFYSTYGYLLRHLEHHHPDLETETVPGVTAMTAGSSILGVPLSEGEESLVVLQAVYGLDDLEAVIRQFDNVVLMKVGKKVDTVAGLLEKLQMKGKAVFISRCGYPDQFVTRDLESLRGRVMDYMSFILIKKKGFKKTMVIGGIPI